jgi:hypothetical protein
VQVLPCRLAKLIGWLGIGGIDVTHVPCVCNPYHHQRLIGTSELAYTDLKRYYGLLVLALLSTTTPGPSFHDGHRPGMGTTPSALPR